MNNERIKNILSICEHSEYYALFSTSLLVEENIIDAI